MASTTPNIGLTLPTGTEGWKRSVINGNFTILDTKIGAVGNTPLQTQINTLSSQLTTVTQNMEPFGLIKYGKVCILRCVGALQTEYADGETIITLPEAFRTNGTYDFTVFATSGERLGMIRIVGTTVTPIFGTLLAGNTRFAFAYIAS